MKTIHENFLWAIIDDGVNAPDPSKVKDIEIGKDGRVSQREDTGTLNHGTRCFYIINSYVPEIPPFVSIKVLDERTERGERSSLVQALYWCLEHSVRLIHMSIGTTQPHDFAEIQKVIGLLHENGAVIVAANNNNGKQTYPAYDSRVIGVACDAALWGRQFVYAPNALNGIQFYASAAHNIKTPQGGYVTPISNSFAAPLITAEILAGLEELGEYRLPDILRYLQSRAFSTSENLIREEPSQQESTLICLVDGTEHLLPHLNDMFAQDGYFSRVVTIPSALSQEVERFIRWASCFYMSDVLLLAASEQQAFQLQGLVDLFVIDEHSGVSPELRPVLAVSHVRSPENIYQNIVELLT